MKTDFDQNTEVENLKNADGARSKAIAVNHVVERMAYQTKLEFEWSDDEAPYGLGSHVEGEIM